MKHLSNLSFICLLVLLPFQLSGQITEKIIEAADDTVRINNCTGTQIVLQDPDPDVAYTLRNNAGNIVISGPVQSSDTFLELHTGAISEPTTFNVLARLNLKSLSFDGVDDYIETEPMIPFENSMTIMARIFPTIKNSIIAWGQPGVNRYTYLGVSPTGYLIYFGTNTNGSTYISSTNIIRDGLWHNVAVVIEGDTASIYVDGTLNEKDFVDISPV